MNKHKIEMICGSLMWGVAIGARPFDLDNWILIGLGALFVAGAWLSMNKEAAP